MTLRRWFTLSLIFGMILVTAITMPFAGVTAAETGRWPSLQEIEGTAWIVFDGQTGKPVLESNADQALFPASTTKIMTAILALESGRLNQTATVSAAAVSLPSGSSKVGFVAGEKVLLQDVLFGLMLASGNDAANVLAEGLAGSQAAFVALMNQKAVKLGMTGSHFSNPSGLHDAAHVVTVRDMAKLAAYAMKNQQFRNLVSTLVYSMPATNKHPLRGWALLSNSNRFLQFGDNALKSSYLSGYEGIKTGSTNYSGSNLVAAATTISGHELISVLFGVPLDSKIGNVFSYSRTLLEEAARKIEPAATATQATTEGTTSASIEKTVIPTAIPTAPETVQSSQIPALTTTAVPAGSSDLASNPWRTACFFLIGGLLITLVPAIKYYRRRRLYRTKIKPRRIK